jgi:GntR family transcriptional regulator
MHSRRSIEDELRRRIQAGIYPPGSSIPTRRELTRELDVSSATLQAAVDRLIDQGFLATHGKLGTRVVERLPSTTCYAIVFGDEPEKGGWNRFWSAQFREANSYRDAQGRWFKAYCLPNAGDPSSEVHQQLCADVRDGGLAGILFTTTPFFIAESPILSAAIPKVCIGDAGLDTALYGSVICFPDHKAHIFQRFAQLGRKRVAAICTCGTADKWKQHAAEARHHGLTTRQEWWLGMPVTPHLAAIARSVTHLLLTLPSQERPDCLIIDDDNLVLHATNGIRDARIQVPSELLVMAYANFPNPPVSAIGCDRYGIDVQALLTTALDELDRQRSDPTMRLIECPIVFRPGTG